MAASTSQTLRLKPLRNASLSLSSKLPLSSAFSVSLHPRRLASRRLVLIVSAGLDAKPTILVAEGRAAGLRVEAEELFGGSYARTLSEWRRRFTAAWPEIARQGFDERFRRLWTYYLAYCEGGFRARAMERDTTVINHGHFEYYPN